jgi:hypothetical protein
MYQSYDNDQKEVLIEIGALEGDGVDYDKPLKYCFDIVTTTNVYNLRCNTKYYSYKDLYTVYQREFDSTALLWLTGIVMNIAYYENLAEHGYDDDEYLTISNINS